MSEIPKRGEDPAKAELKLKAIIAATEISRGLSYDPKASEALFLTCPA